MESIPKIPLGNWIEFILDFLMDNLSGVFDAISEGIESFVEFFVTIFSFIPSVILIAIIGFIAWKTTKWTIGLFSIGGMLLILNLGFWQATLETIALVITAVFISIVIGLPIGIIAAKKDSVANVVTPVLDFMQTMPAFVYLIPAIFFFGTGYTSGIFASIIFAMPPAIRLTNLGIRQVPTDLVEAADAFGSTSYQKMFKVQLPLAMPTIMAGINQTIMLSLSMVVIASMIGAPGLGAEVYRAVGQLKIGAGFEAGLAIVVIAIILDRVSQNIRKA